MFRGILVETAEEVRVGLEGAFLKNRVIAYADVLSHAVGIS
jgi:hypothetical protein